MLTEFKEINYNILPLSKLLIHECILVAFQLVALVLTDCAGISRHLHSPVLTSIYY